MILLSATLAVVKGVCTDMTRQTKNPRNSRCGLENCDCGYVIEKLMKALETHGCELSRNDKPPCIDERPALVHWCETCLALDAAKGGIVGMGVRRQADWWRGREGKE